jgi:peptidoglycan/xylan/chitin deacetylase (PgdA/CDA1 family)
MVGKVLAAALGVTAVAALTSRRAARRRPYQRKSCMPRTVVSVASRGMRRLGWNIDSEDFERAGTNAIVATVKNENPNGPTLLFHDAGGDRSQTVAALREVLPWLKEQGYSFGFPVR